MLNIGRIEYANCTPIFNSLAKFSVFDEYLFTSGVPAYLNELLASEKIDVCPSSSISYAINPDRYLILPGLSISSRGDVASVLLFSKVPIEKLDGEKIFLSSESATSVNLLKILMQKRFECNCNYEVSKDRLSEALNTVPAMLLIGDLALREALAAQDLFCYDLGALWYQWTKLPFVFALWFCTRKAAERERKSVKKLLEQLLQAKKYAAEHLLEIAAVAAEAAWLGEQALVKYWSDNISYELGEDHIKGLQLFYNLSAELGLIPLVPKLHLFK